MTRLEELKALEHLKRRVLKIAGGDEQIARHLCVSLADEFPAAQPAD